MRKNVVEKKVTVNSHIMIALAQYIFKTLFKINSHKNKTICLSSLELSSDSCWSWNCFYLCFMLIASSVAGDQEDISWAIGAKIRNSLTPRDLLAH